MVSERGRKERRMGTLQTDSAVRARVSRPDESEENECKEQ